MRASKRRSGAANLMLAGVAVASLALCVSGCAERSSVVSSRAAANEATLEQQREWVTSQAEAVIAITGGGERWVGFLDNDLSWEQDSQRLVAEMHSNNCTFEETGTNPASLGMDLRGKSFEGDHFALAEQVRELWESEGWKVTDVIRMGDTAAGTRDPVSCGP